MANIKSLRTNLLNFINRSDIQKLIYNKATYNKLEDSINSFQTEKLNDLFNFLTDRLNNNKIIVFQDFANFRTEKQKQEEEKNKKEIEQTKKKEHISDLQNLRLRLDKLLDSDEVGQLIYISSFYALKNRIKSYQYEKLNNLLQYIQIQLKNNETISLSNFEKFHSEKIKSEEKKEEIKEIEEEKEEKKEEIQEVNEKKTAFKELRKYRIIRNKTNSMKQETSIDSTNDNMYDIINNKIVYYLNTYLISHIKKAKEILNNYIAIDTNITIAFYEINSSLSFNPFWINFYKFTNSLDEYDEKITQENRQEMINLLNDNTFNFLLQGYEIDDTNDTDEIQFFKSNHKVGFKTFKFGNKKLSINNIINQINKELSSRSFIYCVVDYSVLAVKQKGINFKNYVKELKAFSPMINQKFHLMTQVSTTLSKLCLYQTYYYLYIDNTKLISKNEEVINNSLNNECDEVKEYIKNGELFNFLSYKSKEHNEPFYIEYFNKNEMIGLLIDNDNVEEIKDINILEGKDKIFLYNSAHVAPKKICELKEVDYKIKQSTFILKPSEIKKKTNNIKLVFGYDFETYKDENNNSIPYTLTLYNDTIIKEFYNNGNNNIVIEFCDYLDSIKTVVDISKTRQNKEVKQILIYGHCNSIFDNIFIWQELLKRNPQMKYSYCDKKIKSMKFHNIRIFDTSLYYACSLDKLGQSFKIESKKMTFPYKFPNINNLNYIGKVPDAKYWKSPKDRDTYLINHGLKFNMKEYSLIYCLRDSELVYKIANEHLKLCIEEIDGKKINLSYSSTCAGMSLKAFCQAFQKDKLYESPKKILEKERISYIGSHTGVFKKEFNSKDMYLDGKTQPIKEYLKIYDINSSYPACMREKMPFKFIKTCSLKDRPINLKGSNLDILYNYYLYYATCKYKGNDKNFIPNLLKRTKDNTLVGLQEIEGYFWGVELKEAIKSGCEVKITEINEYEGKAIFKEFSEYFYNQKLINKEINPIKSLFYKTLLNSLYGKFGQKPKPYYKLCSNAEEIAEIYNKYINIEFDDIGDKILLKYDDPNKDSFSIGHLVRFSSYITASGRSKLHIFMREVGYENVYYADTDSIFTTKTNINDKFLSNTELGKWKLEKDNINKGLFLAPKCYYCKEEDNSIKKVAKGQPIHNIIEDNYIDAFENPEGVKILNENMFFRSLEGVKIKEVERTMKVNYNKRIFEGNNSRAYKNIEEYNKINNIV